jgi:hypothetical protein
VPAAGRAAAWSLAACAARLPPSPAGAAGGGVLLPAPTIAALAAELPLALAHAAEHLARAPAGRRLLRALGAAAAAGALALRLRAALDALGAQPPLPPVRREEALLVACALADAAARGLGAERGLGAAHDSAWLGAARSAQRPRRSSLGVAISAQRRTDLRAAGLLRLLHHDGWVLLLQLGGRGGAGGADTVRRMPTRRCLAHAPRRAVRPRVRQWHSETTAAISAARRRTARPRFPPARLWRRGWLRLRRGNDQQLEAMGAPADRLRSPRDRRDAQPAAQPATQTTAQTAAQPTAVAAVELNVASEECSGSGVTCISMLTLVTTHDGPSHDIKRYWGAEPETQTCGLPMVCLMACICTTGSLNNV